MGGSGLGIIRSATFYMFTVFTAALYSAYVNMFVLLLLDPV